MGRGAAKKSSLPQVAAAVPARVVPHGDHEDGLDLLVRQARPVHVHDEREPRARRGRDRLVVDLAWDCKAINYCVFTAMRIVCANVLIGINRKVRSVE